MIRKKCKNPSQKELWHVDDADALKCIPKEGWIAGMIEHMIKATDAPLWFHLGSILTTLSSAVGQSELKIERYDGTYSKLNFPLWSAIIGISGSRKTYSTKLAVNVLNNASRTDGYPSITLPADGSVEGLHDLLAKKEYNGVGLYYPNELSHLFYAMTRGYSKSIGIWLLRADEGDFMDRILTDGGNVAKVKNPEAHQILEPRVAILGSIPPAVLQEKTSKQDWSSGFLPRFLLWGARKTEDMELSGNLYDAPELISWLKTVIIRRRATVVVPYKTAQPLLAWIDENVNDKGGDAQEDIYSTLTRLQDKAFKMAGLMRLSRCTSPPRKAVIVEDEDIECAMRILVLMYDTLWALYAEVGGTIEGSHEKTVLRFIRAHPRSSTSVIKLGCASVTPTAVHNMLIRLTQEGTLICQNRKCKGPGRPTQEYTLAPDQV